jgi:hypothetical protein
MNFEQLRIVMAKLGVFIPQANNAGWVHVACPYAPWRHRNGVDRSRGFAMKVEDDGISAFKCPACKAHGRISGIARGLAALRQTEGEEAEKYEVIAREADEYDMLGSKLPGFEEQFAIKEPMPDPLDEEAFAGLFEQVADHKEARRYVVSRRISRATIEKLRVEFDADKRRIVFPVRDGEGRLYGWSGRTVIPDHEPRILDYAGLPKRALILGEERWRPGFPKLLVEGLIAYARMHEIGAEEIVDIGALLGSSLTEEKADILKKHGETTIPLVDADKAGDQCLYGQWREPKIEETTGEILEEGYFEGGGLIDVLCAEVPVVLPLFPYGLKDVDDLTFDQLAYMVKTAEVQGQSQRWLDKKSRHAKVSA